MEYTTIKVQPSTRNGLKILAAHAGERLFETAERLVMNEMKKKKLLMVRQGDVLVKQVDFDPTTKKHKKIPRENDRVVLAHGEATGHMHAIVEAGVELIELETGERFILSETGMSIVHEEHGRIELPPGNFEVRIQREYHPEEIRSVRD